MFRRVYKSANDDIVPDDKLLEKILSESKRPKKKHNTYYSYGSMAACIAIAVGTLAIYPTIKQDIHTTKDNAAQDVVVSTASPMFSDTSLLKPVDDKENNTADIQGSDEPSNAPEVKNQAEQDGREPSKTEKITIKKQQSQKAATPKENFNTKSPSTQNNSDAKTEEVKQTAENTEKISVTEKPENPTQTQTASEYSRTSAATVSSEEVGLKDNGLQNEEELAVMPAAVSVKSSGNVENEEVSTAVGGRSIVKISEAEARIIADEIFAADFGREFLNSTEVLADYSDYYTITRYNESASYTIIVYDNKTTQKQY